MEKMLKIDGNLAVQPKERRIITIAANEKTESATLRVAAYARVSTASNEQLNSFAAQNRYYTDFITAHAGWKMVDMYADEGISGTSVEKRDDFQRLMANCRRGMIDRVLCKSISRFARNTKECLEAIRELKSIGVSVFFEEQRIDTAIMSSETITAIMASVAQKESETIGINMQWSYQKRMERGEFLTNTPPYGYRLIDGDLVVDKGQAGVIRKIFRQYLTGQPWKEIADELNKEGIPPCYGANQWKVSSIYHILTNERYTGNALLGKTYALTKKAAHCIIGKTMNEGIIMSNDKLQKFEDQPIRTVWDEESEEWYFSVVDVVRVLTDQAITRNASTYWAVLKKGLKRKAPTSCLQTVRN